MEERTPVIAFRNADILNGENCVIYGLDMEVLPGDFMYIVGKVGTGKTSIIRTMIAENPLLTGEGTVCGFAGHGHNLAFVLKATGWKEGAGFDRRIGDVLEAVGMSHKAHKMPHQLSGGEQQRIAIARSLLNSPEVIIADEPTGNLDPETADGIMQLLRSINGEKGTAVVMVTHNMNICKKYRGRLMVCKDEACTEWTDDEVIDLSVGELDIDI